MFHFGEIEELACQAPCGRGCRCERVPLGPRHPAGGADCHHHRAQGVGHDIVKPGRLGLHFLGTGCHGGRLFQGPCLSKNGKQILIQPFYEYFLYHLNLGCINVTEEVPS